MDRLLIDPKRLEAMVAEHEPFEGQGGGTECTCGWPTRQDFRSRPENWDPSFVEHIFEEVNSFCKDCPDREACHMGWSCSVVKRINQKEVTADGA